MLILVSSYTKTTRPKMAAPTTPIEGATLLAAAPPVLWAAADEEAEEACEVAELLDVVSDEGVCEVAEVMVIVPEENNDENEDCRPANSDDSELFKSDSAVDWAEKTELNCELTEARIDDPSARADEITDEAEPPVMTDPLPVWTMTLPKDVLDT